MYTYVFLRPLDSLNLPKGINGDLQLVQAAGIAAVVEPELEAIALQQSDDRLMQAILWHDQVIQELFQQTTVLPLRFGTQFLSLEKLLTHLNENASFYQTKLDTLVGKAEYTLKFTPQEELAASESSPSSTGRDYFLAKKQRILSQTEQKQQRRDEFEQLKASLILGQNLISPAATDSNTSLSFSVLPVEPRDGTERLYLLVDQAQEIWLLQHLEHWQQQCPHWQLDLSEALPPYHFV